MATLESVNRSRLMLLIVAACAAPAAIGATLPSITGEVTFSRDIAPILQRSCQNCHQPNSAAPMSLISYAEVRPWAKAIKERTLIRDKRGAMPPWYVEKNVGIHHYKTIPP